MKKIFVIIIYIVIIAFISSNIFSCGFQFRSPNEIPPCLRILYLDSPDPYDPLVIQLSRILRALNVHLTNSHIAPMTLRIIQIEWKTTIPSVLYSNNAITYSYSLNVNLVIEKKADNQ